jgi:ribosomal-protein-alanine N-acetyltransferase
MQGERVFLRYPAASDRAEYLAVRRRSRAFLAPWEATPIGGPGPFSAADFDRLMKSRRTESSHRLLVCGTSDGTILGQVSLGGIVRGAFQSAFLGYWIGEEHSRQGFMSEAVSLALDAAFGPLGLHRVEANIIPDNRASLRLVKKLGFRFEGLALRYLRIAGRWQDHQHWAITAEEWPRLRSHLLRRSRARSRVST